MVKTYWNSNGRFQAAADALQALIPSEGSVADTRKNAKLERFRKAVNCYYDLYNNGLCNRAREFHTVFKVASSLYRNYGRHYSYSQQLYRLTEEAMDVIIEDAALEQGIDCTPQIEMFA
jgi:hypothetical protein